jgi:hypothetical protein
MVSQRVRLPLAARVAARRADDAVVKSADASAEEAASRIYCRAKTERSNIGIIFELS